MRNGFDTGLRHKRHTSHQIKFGNFAGEGIPITARGVFEIWAADTVSSVLFIPDRRLEKLATKTSVCSTFKSKSRQLVIT